TSGSRQKTAFQTSSPWIPQIDIRSDVAIVYGANDRPGMAFKQRLQSWKDRGYQTDFMTGIAWGGYQDYFYGKWDGKKHLDEAQVAINNDTVWHGHGIPYIVPMPSYINYFKKGIVKKVIDAGITSLFFEEPEFWARSGYSMAFKTAWQHYYGFPWRPQDQSAENTYLSNKLKYHLYYHAIKEASSYAKAYGKSKGEDIKVYIATHSLVNYSSWKIVSPEASLASLPGIDGYIAQVWTGTAREPTYYNGLEKERVFENAFLEYGSMVSMTAPTGRKMIFLTDPIEDRHRDWGDYKRNYEATFTAEILYPMVDNYEVMPWPERIFTKPYRLPNSDSSVLIPHYYSTQILVMVNALNKLPFSNHQVSGVNNIGVLMGNSLMFQRFPTHDGYKDPQFSNFYGQTLPLLKRGVPVQTVQMENLAYPATLKNIKVLVMSYSNMKPQSPKVHGYLADWVNKGGVLIYCGRDDDPYQKVMEWWNTKGNHFASPSDQLFELLKIKPRLTDPKIQSFDVGKGKVYVIRQDPKEFVMNKGGDSAYINLVKTAYQKDAKAGPLEWKNSFSLQRGPYDIVAVMDEAPGDQPTVIKGPVIDLFDPSLPVLAEKTVTPGHQAFLYDIGRIKDKDRPQVLASASRIYEEAPAKEHYSFVCKGPANTMGSMRVLLPSKPLQTLVTDSTGKKVSEVKSSWDEDSKTLYLGFDNSPAGMKVNIKW
ncbi:MAG TPA: hypothetical protein VFX43_07370, partial [Chitinophagaceae bacterium]|nr:hypothetical protein [Chitinophagaceae bacterium]